MLANASLFLDFDGTLVDLADRPDDVVADAELRALLARLNLRLGGRVAVISGRSIAQLDAILGPVAQEIALSGSHGCEHRWQGISAQPHRPPTLDQAAERMRAFADRFAGALVEEKSYGVALHYRLCPEAEKEAVELAWHVARDLGLELQEGKMMIELRVAGGDKGVAVRRMMRLAPMKGTMPVFIGDDRTDENGFEAVTELGGAGIFVGKPGETGAHYLLESPAAVRAWLEQMSA
ncbi:trehalose-phosphatase [Sphingomonas sp. UNC305MFCol5.2]|uniref:trehalose-phosphatase n=1 Tax=Sphingomonas sp. UNC305MFCol5.2 TaxID=1449076 RepID=UPI000AF16413|nr:trehalose-phosphatase [Sphingomonas sp. UNC305MFCol5.2]